MTTPARRRRAGRRRRWPRRPVSGLGGGRVRVGEPGGELGQRLAAHGAVEQGGREQGGGAEARTYARPPGWCRAVRPRGGQRTSRPARRRRAASGRGRDRRGARAWSAVRAPAAACRGRRHEDCGFGHADLMTSEVASAGVDDPGHADLVPATTRVPSTTSTGPPARSPRSGREVHRAHGHAGGRGRDEAEAPAVEVDVDRRRAAVHDVPAAVRSRGQALADPQWRRNLDHLADAIGPVRDSRM